MCIGNNYGMPYGYFTGINPYAPAPAPSPREDMFPVKGQVNEQCNRKNTERASICVALVAAIGLTALGICASTFCKGCSKMIDKIKTNSKKPKKTVNVKTDA